LHDEGLRVGVVVTLFFEFEFALAEFFDDLIDRDVGRFRGDFGGLVGGRSAVVFFGGSLGGGFGDVERKSMAAATAAQ
jgi:hypothetical protein